MANDQSTSTASRIQRRQGIAEAYLAGEPMEAIAERLGVGVGTVHRDLKAAGITSRSNRKDDIQPGTVFGQLTAVEPRGEDWLCRCSCGQEELANSTALRLGRHVRCVSCRIPAEAPEAKTCTACNVSFPNTGEFFHHNVQHRFGLRARCKKCVQPEVNKNALRFRRELRLEVLSHYSNGDPKCACCGEATFEFLALDHLEGSSREDYKTHGNKFFPWLKRNGYPRKMQVLCHNCNAAKSIHGYCCVHQQHPGGDLPVKKTKPTATMPVATEAELLKAGGVEKACYLCRLVFPASDTYFARHKQMAAGILNLCKNCDRKEHRQDSAARREKRKDIVFAHYCQGSVPHCNLCLTTARPFLTIDHIGGGGAEHRRKDKIGDLHHWLIKNNLPEGFRILCFNCNMSRGFYRYLTD